MLEQTGMAGGEILEQSGENGGNDLTGRQEAPVLAGNVLELLDVPIFVKDEQLRWVYANEAACAVVGIRRKALLGRRGDEIFSKEEAEAFSAYDRHVLATGESAVFEQEIFRGGVRRTVVNRKFLHSQPGGGRFIVAYLTDITEMKKKRRELETRRNYYRSLVESSGPATAVFGDHGVILSCNTQFARLTGVGKAEIAGRMCWKDFVAARDLERLQDYHQRRLDIRNPPPREYEVAVARQGRERTAHVLVQVVPGTRERLVSLVDITESKRTEDACSKDFEKYKALIENTESGFVILDSQGLVVDANDEYCRLAGREKRADVLGRSPEEWTAPFAVESRADALETLSRTGELYHFQTTYQHADGRCVPIDLKATLVSMESGRFFFCLCQDDSERKKAEDALRASEQRLGSLIDTMPVLIYANDANGKIIFWNKECERVLGWTAEEMLHQPEKYRYANAIFFQQMEQDARETSGSLRKREVPMVAKNGEIRIIAWSSRFADISIAGWHTWGTGVDTTERRRYLARLADLNKYLESQVGERTQALETANRKLQEMSARKSAFLSLYPMI